MSFVANIQMLSDDELNMLVPSDYILNVKVINFQLVEFQLCKKLPTDNKTILHYNTEKFAKSHPDHIQGKLVYADSEANDTCSLVALVPNDKESRMILGPIMDRMIKRTNDAAVRLTQLNRTMAIAE